MREDFSRNSEEANKAFRETEGPNAGRYKIDTPRAARLVESMAYSEDLGYRNEKNNNGYNGRKGMDAHNTEIAEFEIGKKAAEINNNLNAMLNTEISDEEAIQMLMASREAARAAISRSRELDQTAHNNANEVRLADQEAEIARLRAQLSQEKPE